MKKKLKSQSGASITFALLLFLVCAIVSSVVMVAASTAGGRLSTIREMDQRYYAATAAAEVIREQLEGKSTVVEYTKETIDEAETITVEPITDADDLLTKVSKLAVDVNVAGNTLTTPLTLASEADPIKTPTEDSFACMVDGTMSNGMLLFNIAVSGGMINRGTYTIRMLFSPDIMTEEDSLEQGKARVAWKLSSLQKTRTNNAPSSSGTPG